MTCEYQGHDICPPPIGPTDYHDQCWTGMTTLDDFGLLDGQGFEVGCVSCRDMPENVLQGGSTALTRPVADVGGGGLPTLLGADRFLYPHSSSPDGRVGANNRQYILRASIAMWAKPGAMFWLGCCFTNFGHECYGEWSTCSCFNEAFGISSGDDNLCPDGTHHNHLLPGFFMDRFAYADLGWAPAPLPTGLFGGSFYARKFTPIHPCSLPVRAVPGSGLYNAINRMPVVLRTGPGSACAVDLFVFLAGVAVGNTECLDGFASSGGVQNHNVGNPYIPLTDPCAGCANNIRCVPDPDDPPRFVEDSPSFPQAKRAMFAMHNRVLAMIWGTQWPDDAQPGGDINFDYLDHGVPNAGVGRFGRTYLPEQEPAAQFIAVKEFPLSHAMWGDLQVDASLVIVGISIGLAYSAVKIRSVVAGAESGVYEAYPFGAVDIEVTYGIRINSTSGTGLIIRTWLDPPTTTPVVITEGPPGTFPSLSPDGNRLVYVDVDGAVHEPPSGFVWHGLLGRLTKPSSDEQRKEYSVAAGTTPVWAQRFLTAASNAYMAGQPALLETNPDAPNQLWGGRVFLTFRDTPGWTSCFG